MSPLASSVVLLLYRYPAPRFPNIAELGACLIK